MGLGQREHPGEVVEGHGYTQRPVDAVLAHSREHLVEAVGEFREIEVAV
jgi:hypothetical protein